MSPEHNPLAQIWAVARLTLKEAIRRRVFLVLVVFGVTLVSVFALMPQTDPTTRLRVLEMWVFRAMTLFVAIIAVFLAGFSLPGEVERRQIYMLASKPVSKVTIIMGKYVGFVMVVLIVLALMGVLSIGVFRVSQAALGKETFTLQSLPRHYASELRVRANKQTLTPKEAERFLVQNSYWLRGNTDAALELNFENLSASDFETDALVKIKLGGGGEEEAFDYSFDALFRFVNPDTGDTWDYPFKEVVHHEWSTFRFPRSVIGSSGRLTIRIGRLRPTEYIYLAPKEVTEHRGGLILYGASEPFEFNFAKATTLLFLETLLILAVSVTASSILSGPVSVLLGIFVLGIASLSGFLTESVEDVNYTIEHVESHGGDAHEVTEIPTWLLRASQKISGAVLYVIPNFSKLAGIDELLDDQAISGGQVGEGVLAVIFHVVILVAIGCGLVLLRDFS